MVQNKSHYPSARREAQEIGPLVPIDTHAARDNTGSTNTNKTSAKAQLKNNKYYVLLNPLSSTSSMSTCNKQELTLLKLKIKKLKIEKLKREKNGETNMGVASKNAEPPQDSNNHKHANKEHVRDNTSALTGWVNSVYEKAIILDTGCTRHVFRKVEDPQECNILLHGVDSTTKITKIGKVGKLTGVLEFDGTSTELVSLTQAMDEGPWTKVVIDVHGDKSSKVHLVYGYQKDKPKVLIAFRNPHTQGLYHCTEHMIGRKNETIRKETHSDTRTHALSTLDTKEKDAFMKLMRALGYPSVSKLNQMLKLSLYKKQITKANIRRYQDMPQESRLWGNLTKPAYTKSSGRGNEKRELLYLEEIHGDTKDLVIKDKNGCRYSFDMVDVATGSTFNIMHKNFKDLDVLIKQKLVELMDDAKRRNLKSAGPDPCVRRMRLDGHPSQVSKVQFTSILGAVTKILLTLKYPVHTARITPGNSRQMGLLGTTQKAKYSTALRLMREQGDGMPEWATAYAYSHASRIIDLIPGPDGKTPFEKREGSVPTEITTTNIGTLFSTVISKSLSDIKDKKIGMRPENIGILLAVHPDRNSYTVWFPHQDQVMERGDCIFNSDFPNHSENRILRMIKGLSCQKMVDRKNRSTTRSVTKQAEQLKLEPVYGTDGKVRYYLAKLNGKPLQKPYCCKEKYCIRNDPLNGLASIQGLQTHTNVHLKKAAAAAEELKLAQEELAAAKKKLQDSTTRRSQRIKERTETSLETKTSKTNYESESENNMTPTFKIKKISATKQKTMNQPAMKRPIASKNKTLEKSRRQTGKMKAKTKRKIVKKALLADSMEPFAHDNMEIQEIAYIALMEIPKVVKEKAYNNVAKQLPDNDSEERGMICREIYDVYRKTPEERADEARQMLSAIEMELLYDKELELKIQETEAEEMCHLSATEIQMKYDQLPIHQDRSPQLAAVAPYVTLRSVIGAHDDDSELFTNNCQKYYEADVSLHTFLNTEIEGLRTQKKMKLGKDGRPLITLETADDLTPLFTHELKNHPYKREIAEAMEQEQATLNAYGTFKEETSSKYKRLVSLKWIFKIKFKNGIFERWKARLVGRGFTQISGFDYDPEGTSSPVARNSTFMILMAEAAKMGYILKEFDVKSAYLLADLNEDVYCKLPYGMFVDRKTQCLKVMKSLYGLKQSGYNWFTKLRDNLEEIGFTQSRNDPCLFKLKRGLDICKIAIWVDDGLVSCSSEELWTEIKNKIDAKSPLSNAGPLKFLLGMAIEQNVQEGIVSISQSSRVGALLETFGMHNCAGVRTPLVYNEKVTTKDRPESEAAERAVAESCGFSTYSQMVDYMRQLIGAFGYLACWGRPDIRFSTYFMARYQARPTKRHYQLVKRILRYLKHTQDLKFVFDPQKSKVDLLTMGLKDKHNLYGLVDSNYTGADDTKSTTGYIFYVYGCPIVCESKKQRATSHSTTEAELIAASVATRRCMYLRRLLTEDFDMNLGITPIGEDNQGCIAVGQGGGNHAKLRHLDVADMYVYQEFKINKTIELRYVASADNVSDMFTKALGPVLFERLRHRLMDAYDTSQ